MRRLALALVLALLGLAWVGCCRSCAPSSSLYVAKRGTEKVAVSMPRLAALTPPDLAKLERYLASHPRWEIREEKRLGGALRYAVRKERDGDAGPWTTSMNGFHSDFQAPNVLQTRVLLGLSGEYGMGSREPTRAAPAAGPVDVALEEESGQPGLSSLLIVTGPVTVEIYEQTRSRRREFTERALVEIEDTLAEALAGPPPAERGAPELRVEEGMQPGIYVVRAKANPGAEGKAYLRVFFVGPDPVEGPAKVPAELAGRAGLELSADSIRQRSTRVLGHSAFPDEVFPYESEVTVYEGDWEHRYVARFELWFEAAGGRPPARLLDTAVTISGWQR